MTITQVISKGIADYEAKTGLKAHEVSVSYDIYEKLRKEMKQPTVLMGCHISLLPEGIKDKCLIFPKS